jgi:putative PIN family toxin of toxin-antitoxin system
VASNVRVVIDPGVLVSAAIKPDGTPGRLLDEWRDDRFEMVVSPALLAELKGVLLRDKFRRYLSVDEVERFVALIRREAELRADPEDIPRLSNDPKDDYLLALGAATRVSLVISGDPHLTELENARPPVMIPARFADLLHSGD